MIRTALLVLLIILTGAFYPLPVRAAAAGCVTKILDSNGKTIANDVPSLGCLADTITSAINAAFVLLGAAVLLFLIYGAIRFVVSGGDQKAVQGARNTMTYAIIAAVLILGSYIIINAVTKALGLPSLLDNFTLYQK